MNMVQCRKDYRIGENMIRDFKNQDIDRIMELWLDTNISVHSFIESEYRKNNYDTVKSMMSSATIYVYEEKNEI